MVRRFAHSLLLVSLAACGAEDGRQPWEWPAPFPEGNRQTLNTYHVLHVAGTPEQMGEQHGRLMRKEVRRVIDDLIVNGEGNFGNRYDELIEGTKVMEPYQPEECRREMRALAEAAGVKYLDVVAAQLWGDVWRGRPATYAKGWGCTSYGAFGPATQTGEILCGRNMDWFDHGVSEYAAVLIHFTPDKGLPFVTVTWAGVINGWTAMNARGIVVANNNGYDGRHTQLEAISTCFLLRKVAQYASSVEDGIDLIRNARRACGTNLIVAGGDPPNAAVAEFDSENLEVRWAKDGYVTADNSFYNLYEAPGAAVSEWSRAGRLVQLIRENYGRADRTMNFAAAPGVALTGINLHSAVLFPKDLTLKVSMGQFPAVEHPYRGFRLTRQGIVSTE